MIKQKSWPKTFVFYQVYATNRVEIQILKKSMSLSYIAIYFFMISCILYCILDIVLLTGFMKTVLNIPTPITLISP